MSKTLFVGGLAFNTKEKDVVKYFKSFGSIKRVRIIKDPRTHASKGYGFVYFAEEQPVSDILSKKGHHVNGRRVDCQSAMDKSEKGRYKEKLSKTRIFVTRLSDHVSNQDMHCFFAQFGPIKSAYVIRDPDSNKSLGFGFVIFERPGDAQKTVGNPDLYIKGEKINCKNYKENDGEVSECFDPVGKRKLKKCPGGGSRVKKSKGKKPKELGGEEQRPSREGRENGRTQGSKNDQNSDRRNSGFQGESRIKESTPRPDLFSLDEERLQMDEKFRLEREFYLISANHFGLSHTMGRNLRMNQPETTPKNNPWCYSITPYQGYPGPRKSYSFWD